MTQRLARDIDPATGSYKHENGNWVWVSTGWPQLYQELLTEYGSIPGDLTRGDKAHQVKTLSTADVETIKQHWEAAAQKVIDDGIIDSFEVVYATINSANPNRLDYGWHWRVAELGEEQADQYYDGNLAYGTSEAA